MKELRPPLAVPSLAEVLAAPALVERLPRAAAIAYRRIAARLVVDLDAQIAASTDDAATRVNEDRLLDVSEVARRLGVSVDYIYEHKDELGFRVPGLGRKVVFSERGLNDYLRRARGLDSC